MTEREHLAFDEVQQAVQLAVQAVQEFYARFPDSPQAAAKNRVAMALNSLDTAADQLAAARQRFAEQQARASAAPDAQTFDREVQ